MKKTIVMGALGIVLLTMIQSSEAQNFSVESGSLDAGGGFFPPGDDILAPGPVPVLVLLGGTGGAFDVNGFSYGRHTAFEDPPKGIDFSVDAGSIGAVSSAVFTEFSLGGPGEQNYDVYRSVLTGTNTQIHDGNGVGPGGTVSPLGMMEPQPPIVAVPFGTGVDGYDNRPGPGPSIYWTWNSGLGLGPSASGADILITALPSAPPGYAAAPSGIYAPEFALGLGTLGPGDNIDALEVWDIGAQPGVFDPGDVVLFSLDPTSPSLGLYGATPADILMVSGPGAVPVIYIPEGALGLMPGDNVTAISVPEPASVMICLVALGLAAAKRRRRR
jgi:hypothetical protein